MPPYARRGRPQSRDLSPEGSVKSPTFSQQRSKGRIPRLDVTMKSRISVTRLLVFAILCLFLIWSLRSHAILSYVAGDTRPLVLPGVDGGEVKRSLQLYTDKPLQPPYKFQFWEAGQRLRMATKWLSAFDRLNSRAPIRNDLSKAIEVVSVSMVPFLATSGAPFQDLRSSFIPNSRGIVIPVGRAHDAVRFAGHLITSLRVVFGCELPIQIAYAGENDLPQRGRDSIAALEAATDLSFLDVLSVFDDSKLRLRDDFWAIKPFAALASNFEQVIILDADTVFLQAPDVLFDQLPFKTHGAYLFHDRLLWQHTNAERHSWLKDQIKEPSPALQGSLFWAEDYAKEGNSGVVVLDKSRPEVLMGLLHTSWQNTYEVRQEIPYKPIHGDKETWWLGLEFAGSGYGFETHYASILGWESPCEPESDDDCICSLTIAHLDDEDNLLWFNGSLLKNKLADPEEYEIPEGWMTDGRWKKGARTEDMNCMTGASIKPLRKLERKALELNIEAAMRVDQFLDTFHSH